MTIDERIEALTMNLELMSRDREADNKRIQSMSGQIQSLIVLAEKDGENIRGLARIADTVYVRKRIHERRLTELEGGDDAT